jgi:hypothetical protein
MLGFICFVGGDLIAGLAVVGGVVEVVSSFHDPRRLLLEEGLPLAILFPFFEFEDAVFVAVVDGLLVFRLPQDGTEEFLHEADFVVEEFPFYF